MLVEYLTIYLVFIIILAILAIFLVLRWRTFNFKLIVPLVIALVGLPAVFVYCYSIYFDSIPDVIVPNLTGTRLETALAKLEEMKLHSRHAGTVFDMKYAEGVVVSQRPEAGRRVKLGRTVSLLTSSGKRRIAVPNILGRPLEQAAAALESRGLLLGRTSYDYVPELDPGIVLTQSPLPGEEVDVGSFIDITVASTVEQPVVEGSGETVDEISVKAEQERQKTEKSGEKKGLWPW
jgi:serine/threonine-protein kinase